jgi:hypothetical protein
MKSNHPSKPHRGIISAFETKDGTAFHAALRFEDFEAFCVECGGADEALKAMKPFEEFNWTAHQWTNGEVAVFSPETFPDPKTAGRFAYDFMNRTGTFNIIPVPTSQSVN